MSVIFPIDDEISTKWKWKEKNKIYSYFKMWIGWRKLHIKTPYRTKYELNETSIKLRVEAIWCDAIAYDACYILWSMRVKCSLPSRYQNQSRHMKTICQRVTEIEREMKRENRIAWDTSIGWQIIYYMCKLSQKPAAKLINVH